MARCNAHNRPDPCFYCERGVPSFSNLTARLEALEDRVRQLEIEETSLIRLDIRNTNLVVRMGGVGDLVCLSSSLKALKEAYPHRSLVLATKPENMAVLAGADFLDGIISIDSWGETQVRHRYDLRYAVEPPGIGTGKLPMEIYQTMDRSDIFDNLLGVTSKKEFTVPLEAEVVEAMAHKLPKNRLLIGINATCNSPVRTMPPEYTEPLAKKLVQEFGATVVLIGKTQGWSRHLSSIQGRHIINLIDRLSLPELFALCSMLDVVITPDTSVTHIAGALKIPCLALFGNIHPQTRVAHYPTVKALYPEGELSCIPCWDMPGFCPRPKDEFGGKCMRLLTPERICAEMRDMILEKAA